MIYTDQQIATVARNAGFTGPDLTTAVAVALAESGGSTSVVNSIGCVGLWQIYAKVHGVSIAAMQDPLANAREAYSIYLAAGRRFTPWTTYTGADTPGHVPTYGLYLVRARAATGATAANPVDTPAPPVAVDGTTAQDAGFLSSLSSIGTAVAFVTNPHNWVRIAEFLLGMILLAVGLWELLKYTSVGVSVKRTVGGAVKTGAAVAAL